MRFANGPKPAVFRPIERLCNRGALTPSASGVLSQFMFGGIRTTWALTLLAVMSSGCLGPRRDDYVSLRQVALADASSETDALWEAIQETLRRGRFRLDRVDRHAGVVTTMPETSQQFFEFWRHDVDSREDLWESTLNLIRRRVHVNLVRSEDGQSGELGVVVYKERFSSPDRQFNSSGAAYQFFGDRLPSTTGLEKVTSADDRWLELGRDPAMEDYLLREILERAGMPVDPAPGG